MDMCLFLLILEVAPVLMAKNIFWSDFIDTFFFFFGRTVVFGFTLGPHTSWILISQAVLTMDSISQTTV